MESRAGEKKEAPRSTGRDGERLRTGAVDPHGVAVPDRVQGCCAARRTPRSPQPSGRFINTSAGGDSARSSDSLDTELPVVPSVCPANPTASKFTSDTSRSPVRATRPRFTIEDAAASLTCAAVAVRASWWDGAFHPGPGSTVIERSPTDGATRCGGSSFKIPNDRRLIRPHHRPDRATSFHCCRRVSPSIRVRRSSVTPGPEDREPVRAAAIKAVGHRGAPPESHVSHGHAGGCAPRQISRQLGDFVAAFGRSEL